MAELVDALDLGSSGATRESSSLSSRTRQKNEGGLMQISIDKLEDLKRKIHVVIPAEQFEKELKNRLSEEAKHAKINGFRPGKVPLAVIEKQYGKEIRQNVIENLIQTSFLEAIEKEKIEMVGYPTQIDHKISDDNTLEYDATFEVYPEFTVNDLTGAKITKKIAEINEEDIEKVFKKLREQYIDWVEVKRETKNNDRVIIDFEGKINGEKFQGGTSKDFALVLGSHTMIPGFEEGLIGKKIDEPFDINVEFPQDYQNKDLAGKSATFTIFIQKVFEGKLPELDDEFAKKLDIKDLEALKIEVKKSMQKELDRRTKDNIRQQVLDILEQRNPITVPKVLVDGEIKQMQTQFLRQMSPNNTNVDTSLMDKLPREYFEKEATKRVLFGLIFNELMKINKITPDNEKVRQKLEDLASAYDDSAQAIQYYYQNKELLKQIEAAVMEEQVIDNLLQNAEVEEQKVSYDELVNAGQK